MYVRTSAVIGIFTLTFVSSLFSTFAFVICCFLLMNRDGFEASRFKAKAKAKAMGLRGQGQGQGHGTSRPRPRPWVIIKVEAKDGREQSVVTMT